MAPTKFGLFKARTRDRGEQPSTENLLRGASAEKVSRPESPIPSTSRGYSESPPDFSTLALIDSEEEDISDKYPTPRRGSVVSVGSQPMDQYRRLPSDYGTTTTTLQDLDHIQEFEESFPDCDDVSFDADSTLCDVNSIQNEIASIAPSEDWSIHCGPVRKPKKIRLREQEISDTDMWNSSNEEVMRNSPPCRGIESAMKKLEAYKKREEMPAIPEELQKDRKSPEGQWMKQ